MGKLHLFADGDTLSGLDADWYTRMRARSAVDPLVSGWSAEQRGGVHRLCWLVRIAPGEERVLDASVDWRDRVCLVVVATTAIGVAFPAWNACRPGGARESRFGHLTTRAWCSGPGTTVAALPTIPPAGGYEIKLGVYAIFARSTDGALCVWRDPTDLDTDAVALLVRISASEPTGEDSAGVPPAQPDPTPTDSTPILSAELNVLQDHGMVSQALSGAVPSDALPLGPKATGSPALPELWTVHGGERRQSSVGAVRRYFVAQLGLNADVVTLDSKTDWRDRHVWACGRIRQGDPLPLIFPGGVGAFLHNSSEGWSGSTYTGRGVDQPSGVPAPPGGSHLWTALELRDSTIETFALWADAGNGVLRLGKDRGDPVIVTGWIEGSFACASERAEPEE